MKLSWKHSWKYVQILKNNDEEQWTVIDLISEMDRQLKDSPFSGYDRRHMKRKLIEHYGESIVISGDEGNFESKC
jgi:hypothetical protein